jgi:RNA polymerase sigma-70 factor (ECF subfamily)
VIRLITKSFLQDNEEVEGQDKIRQMVEAAKVDPTYFAPLYRHFVRSVYRYVLSQVGNHVNAEDITSEVFVEVLAGLSRYQERGYFSAWLFRIARHKVADFYRQQPVEQPLDVVEHVGAEALNLWHHLIKTETHNQLLCLVDALPEDKQELVRLRFAADLTYKEIGKIVGKRSSAVKMALHRLLTNLAQEMETGNEPAV